MELLITRTLLIFSKANMVRNEYELQNLNMKGLNWFVYTKINNQDNEVEGDNTMPRQREIPKIKSVTVIYNGDTKTFDTFMESMINDYLNSDSMPKCSDSDFIDKVEIIDKTTWLLDFRDVLW